MQPSSKKPRGLQMRQGASPVPAENASYTLHLPAKLAKRLEEKAKDAELPLEAFVIQGRERSLEEVNLEKKLR
jgi:hypothetical protein